MGFSSWRSWRPAPLWIASKIVAMSQVSDVHFKLLLQASRLFVWSGSVAASELALAQQTSCPVREPDQLGGATDSLCVSPSPLRLPVTINKFRRKALQCWVENPALYFLKALVGLWFVVEEMDCGKRRISFPNKSHLPQQASDSCPCGVILSLLLTKAD